MIKSFQKGLQNKNVRFIVIRYIIYTLQFGNSLFIARNLGPYFMGEWGFIMLIIQYLTQINFGIPYALNVQLATHEGKNNQVQSQYAGNSLIFTFFHSALIVIAGLAILHINVPIFKKYEFYGYIFLVILNAILQNIDTVFINIFRIKNSLGSIIFYQALMPVTNLAACFFWKGKELLTVLLLSQIVCFFLSFIIFLYNSPIKLNLRIRLSIQKILLKTGMALLLFNASFYFIMIITRTFVSYYYSVKELGYFSFALSFAQASFLALDTISFLLFPKLINRLKYKEGVELFTKIDYVRSNYSLISFLVIFFSILVFPLILIFLPDYVDSFKPFALISLSLAILSGNFGISTLFISGGKEFLLSKIALFAFLINFGLVWIISSNSKNYYMLCLAPLITYIIYSCLLGYFYNTVFLKQHSIRGFFINFDGRLIIPALLLGVAIMLNNITIQVLAYLSVALLNFKRIKGLVPIFKSLINNPALFKI